MTISSGKYSLSSQESSTDTFSQQATPDPFLMAGFGRASFGGVVAPLASAATAAFTPSTAPQTIAGGGTTSAPAWVSALGTASIAADMAAADVNGVVSEAGLTKLLTDLDATLSSTTKLTSQEFADLKTIAANLNVGMSTSAYLTYAFNALVNGNAANATWTGGAASSVALGNLAVGATATQLAELTGKWFLGSDLPSSTVKMSGYSTFSVSSSTVGNALFAASGPSMSDINQGYLGDCYFLSSCAEVAKQDAGDITSMFTNNGNGTYGVRFYVDGVAEYVTVNTSLADGGSVFNHATDIWASLAEKAYAQLQASGVDTGNSINYGNSYSTTGNGGDPAFALEAITGASAINQFFANGSSWSDYALNNALNVTNYSAGETTASLLKTVVADLSAGDDVILSSYTNAVDSRGMTTLVSDHCLSVYGYDSSTGELEIRNPWGAASGQTWDTTFEVSLSTLLADGDVITADNAGVGVAPTVPSAPTVTSQTTTQTWKLGSSVNFVLPSNTFTDPQNETLTYSAKLASGASLPSWLSLNATTGDFTGTVPSTATGLAIVVTATDTSGLTASETFSVSTPASAPTVIKTATQTLIDGKTGSFTLAASTFSDPQGETLSLTVKQSNGAALPSWLSFNAATRTFTGTPPAGAGNIQLEVTATNTSGLQANDIFTLADVAPAAPTVTALTAKQSLTEGKTFSFTLAANTFTDSNGEAMTYAATSSGSALPSWLSFNAATRTFSGAAPATASTLSLSVKATDAGGASASETFSVAIAAAAASLASAAASIVSSSAVTASLTKLASSIPTTLASPAH